MATGNRFDSLYPDKQTRPSTTQVGGSATLDKWDEVNATSGNFGNLIINNGTADRRVPGMYTITVDLTGGVATTVTHNLNNSNPIVQVYGSGTNQLLPVASGLPAGYLALITYVASGTSANAVQVTANSGVAGAKIVVFG